MLVIPNTAVVTKTGIDYVYTVKDGVLKKVAVQLGTADGAVTEISSGLEDGAIVVTEGQSPQRRTEGDRGAVGARMPPR